MRNLIFSLLINLKGIVCGHVRKFLTLHYLLDNICTICVLNLFQQIVGIPMGTNIMLLLLQICFVMRYFMLSFPDNNQAGVIEAFNSISRYLADLLNIDHPYFKQW